MKDGTNTHHEMDRVPGADSAGCDSEEPMDIDSEKKTREMQEKPTSEPAVPPGRAVSHETVDSTATTDTFNEFPFQLGDIVRASEAGKNSARRSLDNNGALGRVVVVKNGLCDVEWVLGGHRLCNIVPEHLEHTALDEPGFDPRSRRRRNTQASDESNEKDVQSGKNQRTTKKLKRRPSPSKAKTKKAIKVGTTAKAKKARSLKGKQNTGKAQSSKTAKKGIVKSGDGKKRKRPEAEENSQTNEKESSKLPCSSGSGQELYERHRREFERCLARLEKIDVYGFFFSDEQDPIPSEFDEQYYDDLKQKDAAEKIPSVEDAPSAVIESESSVVQGHADASACDSTRQDGASGETKETVNPGPLNIESSGKPPEDAVESKKPKKKRKSTESASRSPTFPVHAPYNWEIVRRRMEEGRYVLDRERHEQEERFQELRPYFLTLDRKDRPKRKRNFPEEVNPRVFHKKGVNWDVFRDDVVAMADAAIKRDSDESTGAKGSITYAANKIKETVMQMYERTGRRHMTEMSTADDRHKFSLAIEKVTNTEAAMQSWRRTPFPERIYERLSDDVVCAGLSSLDESIAKYELRTNLPDSFIGLSYRYDDTGQSEEWMKSVVDETGSSKKKKSSKATGTHEHGEEARRAALALAADEGVIRAQVTASMQSLLIAVTDRVMTETKVLSQPELRSANWLESNSHGGTDGLSAARHQSLSSSTSCSGESPEVLEQPVWGIDCYTRRNIMLCLETEFNSSTALVFIEKWLLPAINACPESLGHDIVHAVQILEGRPLGEEESTCQFNEALWRNAPLRKALEEKILTSGPPWLKAAASQLRRARVALGLDFFRVHPKGHGSVLLSPRVRANTLVTFYRGELYPSWRWGEKIDAIDITQKRKGLKPALPDFYNMALERPQMDPRGYGLLFVDASRKAGHGSSLSHSCAPTCEVRVAAYKGELCLAMTTLRELEMGEELTFDYNAVTESLNEYRSAVCLCGYGKCRGSFLHFATADCYQRVLSRNAPIASRFSNLVKGSMKQVMAEDDERVLRSHGFQTAAFGAISVNRHHNTDDGDKNGLVDAMDFVPVWLRTYVADTLRYIEYERRALPIALICDHLSTTTSGVEESIEDVVPSAEPTKPEPTFFLFSREKSGDFHALLIEQGFPDSVKGLQLQQAIMKVAGGAWKALSKEEKQEWKEKANADFEKKRKVWRAKNKKRGKTKEKRQAKPGISEVLHGSKISFQDADAEGNAAMEQRIQQLTQTLSRVGRVLDRHREGTFSRNSSYHDGIIDSQLRNRVHAPIKVLSDEEVVGWMWNSQTGVVLSLVQAAESSRFVRTSLVRKLHRTCANFSELAQFRDPTASTSIDKNSAPRINGTKARKLLRKGLLQLRSILIQEHKDTGKVLKQYNALRRKEILEEKSGGRKSDQIREDTDMELHEPIGGNECARPHEEALDRSPPEEHGNSYIDVCDASIAQTMEYLVEEVERRIGVVEDFEKSPVSVSEPSVTEFHTSCGILKANPWIKYRDERSKMLATADLLLFYANTSNFFVAEPYSPLTSTPIEVYARELGNAVPVSAMDLECSEPSECSMQLVETKATNSKAEAGCLDGQKKSSPKTVVTDDLCKPDDIVAKVSVSYDGDYVLSQLLQWYNGGIGQGEGLPEMTGCVVLPDIAGCLNSNITAASKKKTTYEAKVRPRLIEWLQDPYQRGGPWPEEIAEAFVSKDSRGTHTFPTPFGSPIVDFLVSGDESNITDILYELDGDDKVTAKKKIDGMLESVDKGRPAQAVSNWVQCEKCLKWRKIPWHVDVDLLPETFYCWDNKWDTSANYCDALEDDWDEDDKLVDDEGKVSVSPLRRDKNAALSPVDEKNFFVGARFDVLRGQGRRAKFTIGTITHVDLSGKVKRVRFHFHKTRADADEWVELGSGRIAPLFSRVQKPKPKSPQDSSNNPANAAHVTAGAKQPPPGEVSSKPPKKLKKDQPNDWTEKKLNPDLDSTTQQGKKHRVERLTDGQLQPSVNPKNGLLEDHSCEGGVLDSKGSDSGGSVDLLVTAPSPKPSSGPHPQQSESVRITEPSHFDAGGALTESANPGPGFAGTNSANPSQQFTWLDPAVGNHLDASLGAHVLQGQQNHLNQFSDHGRNGSMPMIPPNVHRFAMPQATDQDSMVQARLQALALLFPSVFTGNNGNSAM